MAGVAANALRAAGIAASNALSLAFYLSRGLPWYTSLYGTILSFRRENPGPRTDALVAPLLEAMTVGERVRTLPIPGGRVAMPRENMTGLMVSIYEVFIQKEYERYRDYIPSRKDVVVDVGAYVGLWTIHVARQVGGAGRVVAVEPNPYVFSQLERNVAINGFKNVAVSRRALGDREGSVEIYGEAKESSLASMYRDRVELYLAEEKISAMTAKMTTLDGLLEEHSLGRADIVKIDAEGAELSILEGARRSLDSGSIGRLIVEVHQDRCSNQQVADLLRSHRFATDHSLNDPDPRSKKGFVFSTLRR